MGLKKNRNSKKDSKKERATNYKNFRFGIGSEGVISPAILKSDHAFVCYSRADKKYLKDFQKIVAPRREISIFCDLLIEEGQFWHDKIQENIEKCKAGIIFLSSDFIASDYIMSYELKPLMKMAEKGKCTLYIFYISDCQYDVTGLQVYQFVNPPNRPLDKMPRPRRLAIYNQLVTKMIEQYYSSKVTTSRSKK